MTPAEFATLRQQVRADEGLRLKPYTDTAGKIGIGYGRNLTDNGISTLEAAAMLDADLVAVVSTLPYAFPITTTLTPVRFIVLCQMLYNLGESRLRTFAKMWAAIARHDDTQAALEMLDSKWARQVGARATRLAEAYRTSEWPDD